MKDDQKAYIIKIKEERIKFAKSCTKSNCSIVFAVMLIILYSLLSYLNQLSHCHSDIKTLLLYKILLVFEIISASLFLISILMCDLFLFFNVFINKDNYENFIIDDDSELKIGMFKTILNSFLLMMLIGIFKIAINAFACKDNFFTYSNDIYLLIFVFIILFLIYIFRKIIIKKTLVILLITSSYFITISFFLTHLTRFNLSSYIYALLSVIGGTAYFLIKEYIKQKNKYDHSNKYSNICKIFFIIFILVIFIYLDCNKEVAKQILNDIYTIFDCSVSDINPKIEV